jgi:hypothetical protein
MNSKELKRVLGMISKVLADPRCRPGYGDQLRKAKREFEAVSRSGKLDQGRLFRAVEIVATVLKEIVTSHGLAPSGPPRGPPLDQRIGIQVQFATL